MAEPEFGPGQGIYWPLQCPIPKPRLFRFEAPETSDSLGRAKSFIYQLLCPAGRCGAEGIILYGVTGEMEKRGLFRIPSPSVLPLASLLQAWNIQDLEDIILVLAPVVTSRLLWLLQKTELHLKF